MKNLLRCLLTIVLSCEGLQAHNAFVTTGKATTAREGITIPVSLLHGDLTGYDYAVDLGDNHTSGGQSSSITTFTGDSRQPSLATIEQPDANGILYVDSAIATPGDGSSWAKAVKYLSDAIIAANADSVTLKIKEIHVAQGTYYPTGMQSGTDRDGTFAIMRGGLKLLGGYPHGGGIRDWKANSTILSANINDPTDSVDNSRCIMTISQLDSMSDSLVVEGFTLTGAWGGLNGAGLSMKVVANGNRTRISDCRFTSNHGGFQGGAMFVSYSSPQVTHCTFSGNHCDGELGGGAYMAFSSPTFANCTFRGNSAYNGSALYIDDGSSPTIMNCIVSDNNTGDNFSTIESRFNSSPHISNCVISGNNGGGIVLGSNGGGYSEITNCTIYGNRWGIVGNLRDNASKTLITNSIIYGNGSALYGYSSSFEITYSLVQGMAADPVNHILDSTSHPMFADTLNGDFSLTLCSPVINKGSNQLYTDAGRDLQNDKDLNNDLRLVGDSIDMGAFEFQGTPEPGACSACPPAGDSILYVDSAAADGGNGFSWATAFNQLQYALDLADSCDQVNQIWVAKGTYKPYQLGGDGTGDRDMGFVLIPNVRIYGGFAGNEPAGYDVGDRDFKANETVLSGDIGAPGDSTDNCYHVVMSNGDVGLALLDGFTITGGNADIYKNEDGGGMYLQNSKPLLANLVFTGNRAAFRGGGMYNEANSSPTLSHIVFTGNSASSGAGMFNTESSPTLTDVTFSSNQAGAFGGGIDNSNSSPVLTRVAFNGNSAAVGGGMYNVGGAPVLADVTFSLNTGGIVTGSRGGGMFNQGSAPILANVTFTGNQTGGLGGGMCNLGSSPTLSNVTFSGNRGSSGGGMSNRRSSPRLTNVSFSGNSADSTGGAMFNMDTSAPTLTNVILWNNEAKGQTGTTSASIFNQSNSAPRISFSLIANSNGSGPAGPNSWKRELGIDGGGNIDGAPFFIGTVNPDDAPTLAGDLHLAEGSSAINTGDPNTDLTTFPKDENGDPIDLDHNLRVFNKENGGTVDMGAYEYQGTSGAPCPPAGDSILYVDSAAAHGGNGISWATAFNKMQDALGLADSCGQIKQIWVAKGTYMPEVDSSFCMLPAVRIYGGFAGTETSLDQRDLAAGHTSILKGNGSNVIRNESNRLDTAALLDGFTVTGGKADNGGGIYNVASSPALRHLIISGNTATNSGGGICNDKGSSPVLTDVTIRSNTSTFYGGGMFNYNASSPLLKHVTISGNNAEHGGGIFNYNSSSPTLINVAISADTAYYGGGISNWGRSSPVLINVTISRNEAWYRGGAMHSKYSSSPVLINSILWSNDAGAYGGDELNSQDTSTVKIYYSLYANGAEDIVTDASSTLTASDTLTVDPQFVDAANENYALTLCSPAIDNGSNQLYTDHGGHLQKDKDLKNNPRLFGEKIDIGVYEFQGQAAPPTVISAQPKDTAVCGQEAAFSISATGYRLRYQWQSSRDGKTWNQVTVGTDPTLKLSNIQHSDSGTLYRVVLISGCQKNDTSATATLTVTSGPTITRQPQDLTVFEGSAASFSITAAAATGYQWQLSDDNGETWTNAAGGTGSALSLSNVQASDNGSQYRVVVKSNCGNLTSRAATLIVRKSGSCITITAAPQNQTVCTGSDATFSINATGATGYQWQSSTDGNTWNNVTGGMAASLKRSGVQSADNGDQYRVIVHGDCGSIISGSATLTVRTNAEISVQPENQTVCEGGSAVFSIKATGTDLKYQWQSSSDGANWNNETAETAATLELSDLGPSDNGTKYHVVISSRCGSITSRAAALTIHAKQYETLHISVCHGSRYSFGGKDISKSGTYTDTLTSSMGCDSIVVLHLKVLPEIRDTLNETICEGGSYTVGDHQYDQPGNYTDTLHAVNGCDSIIVLHLQVNARTIITAQPQNQAVCAGGAASFSAKADGTDLKYQWQVSKDGTNWNSVTGATSETLKLTSLEISQNETQYRVIISSHCDMVTSGLATLTVLSKAAISVQPQDQTVCAGKDATFRVKADGTNLTFQWQSSPDGNNWNNIAGEASEMLKLSKVQTSDSRTQYRVVVTGVCDRLTSKAVLLNVSPVPAITITADQENPVSKGVPTHLSASGADSYQWVNGADIQSGLNEATLTISPRQQATYTVMGTTAAGCSTSQDYEVTIVSDYKFRIHNIVTPNGDGKNDTWIIENIDSYPDNEVEIFDRSGRMIYHQRNYSNQWEGTVVGGPLQEGTYYYIFAIDGQKKLFKGFLELLRER